MVMSTVVRGMKSLRGCSAVLALLSTMVLLPGESHSAQPRAPTPKWKDPAGPPTPMEIWLVRLVGRYRVEGVIRAGGAGTESVKGMADCVAIGAGPGVQCVLNVAWLDLFQIVYPPGDPAGVFNVPGGVSFLNPAMALFGIDPGAAGINYLLVDNAGLAEGGLGSSTGNRATFRTSCVNAPTLFNAMIPPEGAFYRSCDRIIRIDAKPDAGVVHLLMDIEINEDIHTTIELTLRRLPRVG
jgi:hypothetical protein